MFKSAETIVWQVVAHLHSENILLANATLQSLKENFMRLQTKNSTGKPKLGKVEKAAKGQGVLANKVSESGNNASEKKADKAKKKLDAAAMLTNSS